VKIGGTRRSWHRCEHGGDEARHSGASKEGLPRGRLPADRMELLRHDFLCMLAESGALSNDCLI
jgi:hypothetical protein